MSGESRTGRTFSEHAIRIAIENYRQQHDQASRQLQELERQGEVIEQQRQMITGAILGLEALLNGPAESEPPTPPPTDTSNES